MADAPINLERLSTEQLLGGIYGICAAIGHDPELVTELAERGRRVSIELRNRWPALRRRAFSTRRRSPVNPSGKRGA